MSNDQSSGGEFMLFGVRVVVDSMRKSVSLNNLSQYEHPLDSSSSMTEKEINIATGYASADEAVNLNSSPTTTTTNAAAINRERKRGVPWTEEEHKLFLQGLQKVGKGDWRGISRNFVKTRTPTQVASHAQKYFLRRSNLNRRRRRSSLFDITTDTVAANATNDQISKENNGASVTPSAKSPPPQQQPPHLQQQLGQSSAPTMQVKTETSSMMRYPSAVATQMIYPYNQTFMDVVPAATTSSNSVVDLDLNNNHNNNNNTTMFDLSLNLSLSMTPDLANSRHSAFSVTQGFSNGDSIISVA